MKYSLKLKISLLFLFAFASIITIATLFIVKFHHDNDKDLARYSIVSIIGAFDKNTKTINIESLLSGGFTQIEDKNFIEKLAIKAKTGSIDDEHFSKRLGPIHKFTKPKLVKYSRDNYLLLNTNNETLAFGTTTLEKSNILMPILFAVIIILLLILYIATLKNLKPLGVLRDKILEFRDGNDEINCKIKGNDEIAEVANAFDSAVRKIKSLRHSRQLFLRNIMHEFKTPITKGKLSTELLEDNQYKEILQKVFQRQEVLLNEFLRIEQLGTGELILDKDEYFLRDIVDYSLDIIGENAQNVKIDLDDMRINADFDLFATALKNLIDNALLYSDGHKASISAKDSKIIIKNVGKRLEFDLSKYKEPFFLQGKKQKESRGLGFGLFIAIHLIELHGMSIEYAHTNKESIFIINTI